MLKEFKEFAVKGNVMDMAVGIVIGGAFAAALICFPLASMLKSPVIAMKVFGGARRVLPRQGTAQRLATAHPKVPVVILGH